MPATAICVVVTILLVVIVLLIGVLPALGISFRYCILTRILRRIILKLVMVSIWTPWGNIIVLIISLVIVLRRIIHVCIRIISPAMIVVVAVAPIVVCRGRCLHIMPLTIIVVIVIVVPRHIIMGCIII